MTCATSDIMKYFEFFDLYIKGDWKTGKLDRLECFESFHLFFKSLYSWQTLSSYVILPSSIKKAKQIGILKWFIVRNGWKPVFAILYIVFNFSRLLRCSLGSVISSVFLWQLKRSFPFIWYQIVGILYPWLIL